MKKSITIIIALLLILSLSGCVTATLVSFESNIEGAEIILDGKPIGKTPLTISMSNGIWEEPRVRVEKSGYNNTSGAIEKEIKPGNLMVGIFLWWPSLLWCYGPKTYQYYYLNEK